MELLPFLTQQNLFTQEECLAIEGAFKRETFAKGEAIPLGTRYAKSLFFIEAGLLRTYYVQDGKDITHFFFDENAFMAAVNSVFFNKAERYNCEAIEPLQLKVIPYEKFLQLQEQYPKLTRLLLGFTIFMLDLFSQKLNLHQFQSAEDKYAIFQEMYPNLNHRVSLGSIASFLGITQQTLSVVRAKKS